jgi:hypothetical protein
MSVVYAITARRVLARKWSYAAAGRGPDRYIIIAALVVAIGRVDFL